MAENLTISGEKQAFDLRSALTVSRLNVAVALVAALISWRRVATISLPATWQADFQYFWQAAQMWASGRSPYLADYVENGAATFALFVNPFFYPPNILPLISPLAALAPHDAASLLFMLSAASVFALSIMLSRQARRLHARMPVEYLFIILICVMSFYMRPFLKVAMYGQITILLALGFAAFLIGRHHGRGALVAIGLVALLVKPQFGLPVAVFALMQASTRAPALIAIAVTGVFAALGLMVGNPIENFAAFLNNIATYSHLPENQAGTSGGLNQLYILLSIELPLVVRVGVALAPAFFLARIAKSDHGAYAAACAALVWACIALPTHSTDFVILIPALVCLFLPTPFSVRAAIGVGFLLLGRSWDIALRLAAPGQDHAEIVGFVHSAGLIALFAGLCATAWSSANLHATAGRKTWSAVRG
jgi:hypothetical protein